jgi:hypothetical protein
VYHVARGDDVGGNFGEWKECVADVRENLIVALVQKPGDWRGKRPAFGDGRASKKLLKALEEFDLLE